MAFPATFKNEREIEDTFGFANEDDDVSVVINTRRIASMK